MHTFRSLLALLILGLTIVSENEFSFTVPAGALPGAAYVTALNPPFIPFSPTTDDPDGAFTLP